MKKNVLVIAGLAVLSTSAHATKARMEALGQGTESFYLSDSRSVFLNPAALNDTKNYIVTEWGTNAQGDSQTAPRAEGGFFREMGSFAYGLYLGNNGDARTTGAADKFLDHQNALDLVLAGDMGVKWGARVHYANSKDETLPTATPFERKNSALGLALGAISGDMEGYANLDLSDKSTGATVAGDVWKNKLGMKVGGSYKFSGMTFFADYASTNKEVSAAAGSTLATVDGNAIAASSTVTLKSSDITVGAAKVHEVTPGARIVTDARLVLGTEEVGGSSTAASNGKTKTTNLPVTFAMEADATSWLVVRGSVSQNVILGETKTPAGKKTTGANSAVVNAGATLNFGKLKADGMIGTTASNGNAGSNTGVLSTSNLLTRVGVSYSF